MFLVWYKKSSPNLRPQNFSLLFFPESFMVLCFRFRSVVNFELICVYDWVKAKVVFYMWISNHFNIFIFQLFQHIIFHWITFVPLLKINWPCVLWVYSWALFSSIDIISCYLHNNLMKFYSGYPCFPDEETGEHLVGHGDREPHKKMILQGSCVSVESALYSVIEFNMSSV